MERNGGLAVGHSERSLLVLFCCVELLTAIKPAEQQLASSMLVDNYPDVLSTFKFAFFASNF